MSVSFRFLLGCIFVVCAEMTALAQYVDITQDLGITHTYVNNDHIGGGVALIDYNADGWLDLVFTGGESPDRLYENQKNGEFKDVSAKLQKPLLSHVTSSVVSGDFNNDGCVDLYFSVYNRDASDFILINDCAEGFYIKELNNLGNSIGATLFDFNRDGFLDIYTIGYVEVPNPVRDSVDRIIAYDHTCGDNFLYLNEGNLDFVDATDAYEAKGSGCSLAVTVVPIPDLKTHAIYIANDFGEFLHPNQLLVLTDESVLVDEASLYGIDKRMYGMGIGIGDYDNDLDLDLYVSNLGENILYQNNQSHYVEVQQQLNVENTFTPDGQFATSWGTFFLDVDNDTDLDLFVANGFLFTPEFIGTSFIDPNQLYLNSDGRYVNTDTDFGIRNFGPGINRGAAMGDLDNDGDLDIIVSYINFEETSHQRLIYRIYDNVSDNDNNYLEIKLEATTTALDAYGSQVILYAESKSWLTYHYSSGIHCSQNTTFLHFGLKDIETIDSIKVIWPNYSENVYLHVPINRQILLKENSQQAEVYGCMNQSSLNYDPEATIDLYCLEDGTTSTDEFLNKQITVSINQTIVTLDASSDSQVFELFDVSGRLIIREKIELNRTDELNVLVPTAVSGIYICSLTSKHRKIFKKIYLD